MYNKHYFLYVVPIKGEENSIERQLESGEKFRQLNTNPQYRDIITENENETAKPLIDRRGFEQLAFTCRHKGDDYYIVMDIAVLNGMDYYDLRDIKSYFRSADFILISDGRFVANLGLEYPFPLTKFVSEETKESDIKGNYRSFERAAVYCCKRTDNNSKNLGQLVIGINIMPMITATRNLHVYFETDDVTGPVAGRRCYNSLLEEVRASSYDIVLTFTKAFREDEVDGVISEIRKYVPVIFVDEDEKINFLDILKD